MPAYDRTKFTVKSVAAAPAGRHRAGPGLYLIVTKANRRRWVFRFTAAQTRRVTEMGLGSANVVTLAEARARADEARSLVRKGVNPIDQKRAMRSSGTAFGEVVADYIEVKSPEWRSDSQLKNINLLLNVHCKALANVAVSALTPDMIVDVLRPLWARAPAQGRRVLNAVDRVLNYARARGLRAGENPATWRGLMEHRFPKRRKIDRQHYAAIDYVEIPALIDRLRQRQPTSMSARAIEFCILTAARTAEVVYMTWAEVDFDARLWTLPATRTKAGRDHRVPLSRRAIHMLEEQHKYATSDVVWTGYQGKSLSDKAMYVYLRECMGIGVPTLHGMRSAFRDWAGNETSTPRDIAEQALSHAVGNSTELAYRRSDALAKRRILMEEWAAFVEPGDPKRESR